GKQIQQTDIMAPADPKQVIEVRIPVPAVPTPPSPRVIELPTATGLKLPPALLQALTQRNILTLADIRKAGGIATIVGLPVSADDPEVQKLQAHAELAA